MALLLLVGLFLVIVMSLKFWLEQL